MAKKNVLIVDDTSFMRMTLSKILIENGFYIIAEAISGEDAVKKYRELSNGIDVITMDINMSCMNGIDTVKAIIEINNKAKILMVSSLGEKEIIMDAIKAGAKGFVVKPYKPETVINAIKEIL